MFVLWIFTISSVFMFSRSRNPLLTFPMSCYVWVTSKIEVNFRYRRYSKVLMIVSYRFWNFFTVYVFEVKESIADIPNFLHVRMTSKIQVNFRFRRYWWFCLIRFWNFFTVYVFEVRESIADIPTELTRSRKSGPTSVTRGFSSWNI